MSALEKRKQKTREKILFAAYTLFTTHGFEETPVDAIAHEAGVSRKTLFNYFASKDLLLWEIARFWYEQAPATLTSDANDKPALHTLREIFLDQLRMLEKHRPFMQMVLRHSNGMDIDHSLLQPGRPLQDRCMAEAYTLFGIAEQRGELRQDIRAEAAYEIYAALRNLIVRRWLLMEDTDPNSLIVEANLMLDVFFSGCACQPTLP